MSKTFLSVSELFSEYARHFFRTLFVVAINLIIARLLLSSEFFGDFRVAVKFLILLGGVLSMLYPFLENLLSKFSKRIKFLVYAVVLLGITGLLNGGYIISRSVVHQWSFVAYLNHHPIHILLLGAAVFATIQVTASRLSATFTRYLYDASYVLFGIILLVAILLLPELNINTIVMLFLLSQCLLLGVAWSMHRFGDDKGLRPRHVTPNMNLMQYSSLVVALFALELLSTEQSVTDFANIMIVSSLMFVMTQPLAKSLEGLNDWSKSYLPQLSHLIWINAAFAMAMFLILMPLLRYLIAWISGGLILDFEGVNPSYLAAFRVALLGYLWVACLVPFFSILMRFNEQVAHQVQYFKLGILIVLSLVLVPPYGLYGAIASEIVTALAVYGFYYFYLVDNDAIDIKDLKQISC